MKATVSGSARINYVSETPGSVTVQYWDLPANVKTVIVNSTTGAHLSQTLATISAGGTGQEVINLPSHIAPGAYYVLATDGQTGAFISQTVPFYVATREP